MTVAPSSTPRRTLAPELRHSLADDILAGRLPPGTRLDERLLAAQWGMSRTPVREALKQLAVTGLVESHPHRGVFVARLDPEQLREMFELAGELEASCARLAALRMSAEERRQLEAMHRASQDWVAKGQSERYDSFNLDFHAAIFRGCHNQQLVDATLSVRSRVTPFRRAQFNILPRLGASFSEHQAIVDAIVRADAETAAQCMRGHISSSLEASERYRADPGDSGIQSGEMPYL